MKKKICILMGSPRKNGNTAALASAFAAEAGKRGNAVEVIWLHDKEIQPCRGCRTCQKDWNSFGCPQNDDMPEIAERVLQCELLVIATPVYSWYCTPPVKAVMDRLVYGLNKYYGDEKGPSLWKGKQVALITTCGYPPEKGADLLEEGIKRYCRHSQLQYLGMLTERHLGYDTVFMDEEKEARARAFAQELLRQ